MANPTKIVFVNGKSECGCIMTYSDGHGEYSDVHEITLCENHDNTRKLPEILSDRSVIRTMERNLYNERKNKGK